MRQREREGVWRKSEGVPPRGEEAPGSGRRSAREPTGAQHQHAEMLQGVYWGRRCPYGKAQGGSGGLLMGQCSLSLRTHLLPASGDERAGRAQGPRAGRAAAGSCARWGVPLGWGALLLWAPGRRKQGKTRRTTFWRTRVAWQRRGKTTRPAAESPGGGQGCGPGQREARAAAAGGRLAHRAEPLSHGQRAAR